MPIAGLLYIYTAHDHGIHYHLGMSWDSDVICILYILFIIVARLLARMSTVLNIHASFMPVLNNVTLRNNM